MKRKGEQPKSIEKSIKGSVSSSPSTSQGFKRIIYTSHLNTSHREDIKILLKSIFKGSNERNKALNVYGLLYCNFDTFNIVQVLEGPSENLSSLFNAIARDTRHTNVSRLCDKSINFSDKWLKKLGIRYGNKKDWGILKEKIPMECPDTRFFDQKPVDLRKLDMLPLAGNLDLSLVRLIYTSRIKTLTKDLKIHETDVHSTYVTNQSNDDDEDTEDLTEEEWTVDKKNRIATEMMQNIIESAQKVNEKLLIGGILHMDANFNIFQCLEGPANAVNSLFDKIKVDDRHHEVKRIYYKKVNERRFKTWGMIWTSEKAKLKLLETIEVEDTQILLSTSNASEEECDSAVVA